MPAPGKRWDFLRKLSRLKERAIWLPTRWSADPIQIWKTERTRSMTKDWYRAVSAALRSKGFTEREERVTRRAGATRQYERRWIWYHPKGVSIAFVGLADHSWVFDMEINGRVHPVFLQHRRNLGTSLQGVPDSMSDPEFGGVFTPAEGRRYAENLTDSLRLVRSIRPAESDQR